MQIQAAICGRQANIPPEDTDREVSLLPRASFITVVKVEQQLPGQLHGGDNTDNGHTRSETDVFSFVALSAWQHVCILPDRVSSLHRHPLCYLLHSFEVSSHIDGVCTFPPLLPSLFPMDRSASPVAHESFMSVMVLRLASNQDWPRPTLWLRQVVFHLFHDASLQPDSPRHLPLSYTSGLSDSRVPFVSLFALPWLSPLTGIHHVY